MTASTLPDGISDEYVELSGRLRRHANPIGVVLLGLLLLAAFLGFAGREVARTATGGGAELRWEAPEVIRNGEFFEIRIRVTASEGVGDLGIGVPSALWEDITINTMFPAATEETSEDGELRFTFGPLEAGSEFLLKVDAQINPDIVGSNEGVLRVYDGDEQLVELPVRLEVRP
jgi:hypothetical protein